MSCDRCAAFGGFWEQTPAGLRRCTCDSGRRLAGEDEARKLNRTFPPAINPETAVVIVEMLSAIPYFPSASGARLLIAEEIRSMCPSAELGMWLAQRMVRLYESWPGPRELRLVLCSRCRPLDGHELIGGSETYPDGIPSEHPSQIETPPMKALGPGDVSAAESINQTVLALAEAKDLRNVRRAVPVPDIPILPPGQRISQADIDAAVNRNRERIAREEAGL